MQVVYSLLAASFLIGFVFFGIGSGGIGSVSDLFGGGSGGSTTSQYDDQINAANEQLRKDPKDTKALSKLALSEYLKGKTGITQDASTGQISISSDAHDDLGKAADAWTRYLRLNKAKPNASVAGQVVNAFIYLNDGAGAARTQEIVAANQPSSNSYGNLAVFRYLSGDIAGGDEAVKHAQRLAPKAQRKQVKTQLDAYRKQGLKLKKEQAKASKNGPSPTTPGADPLQSPLGGTP